MIHPANVRARLYAAHPLAVEFYRPESPPPRTNLQSSRCPFHPTCPAIFLTRENAAPPCAHSARQPSWRDRLGYWMPVLKGIGIVLGTLLLLWGIAWYAGNVVWVQMAR